MRFELYDLNKIVKATMPEVMKNYVVVFDADTKVNDEIILALVKGIGDGRTRMKLVQWGMANDLAHSKTIVDAATVRVFGP